MQRVISDPHTAIILKAPEVWKLTLPALLLATLVITPVLTRSAQDLAISGPAVCRQGETCSYTASGGSEPYTFTLVSGSVGSITSDGAYTAPARIIPKQVINGCQGTPDNSVFNTPVDSLPVHASSALWLSNMDPGGIYYTGNLRIHGSTVLSTDPLTLMKFLYTPQADGPFVLIPFPYTLAQSGTEVPGGLMGPPGRDEHIITTYRDNCRQQELYQFYQPDIYRPNPNGNAQSGVLYSLTDFVHPGYGTDAAGTYLSPLTVHLDELLAAQAGNLDAVQHAVRFTEDAASIDASTGIWPAQQPGGAAACRGGQTLPHTACPPYGARFRLKSSFVWPGFDGLCPSKACQNVVNALLRAQQRYGLILADVGSNGNADYDGGQYTSSDMGNALVELYSKLTFNKDNFEAVDESVLNTNQGGTGADQRWLEAKLNNGFVAPTNAVLIMATDKAGSTAYYSVALQGVAIGVPNPGEVVMAGAAPIQFSPWVTGTPDPGYSCSLSPGGGANGVITSGCLYTPPSTSEITVRTDTTVTVTSTADPAVNKSFNVTILPVSSDGSLHISLGKAGSSALTYTDENGIMWWNDMPTTRPLALFPDYSSGGGGGPYTGANSAKAPGLYTQGEMGTPQNDLHFPIWVPDGIVTGTVYLTNFATAAGQQGFSFDCNGQRAIPVADTFTYSGSTGPHSAAALSCSVSVTSGQLHMALRWQGVKFEPDSCCTLPVYHPGQYGVWAAALVVRHRSPAPRRITTK